jgi:hypothetical protein
VPYRELGIGRFVLAVLLVFEKERYTPPCAPTYILDSELALGVYVSWL